MALKNQFHHTNQPEQIECEIIERQREPKAGFLLCEVFRFSHRFLCDYYYKIESILHVIFWLYCYSDFIRSENKRVNVTTCVLHEQCGYQRRQRRQFVTIARLNLPCMENENVTAV